MSRYIFFTNIPSPYRVSFYNELYERGLDFEVYYMRLTEGDRSWKVDLGEIRHPHFIDRGLYAWKGRFHFHFNPRLIWKLLRSGGAEIVLAASWNDIDVLLLVTLKRLGILKNQLHFWSEANYLSIGARNDHPLKSVVRKYVYNSSTGAQLASGEMTKLTFEKWGMPDKRYVPLPNTIEEERFAISDEDVEARERNPLPVFLLPVRLTEKIKGIMNFFRSIGVENVRRGLFLVAGDGPDREAIEAFVRSIGAEEHIHLLGHRGMDEIVPLYRRANVMVLPSFTDASPLTLVEALVMRLPVLVSERCGNHFEAVVEGRNGYLFDPSDPRSVRAAFESLMRRRAEWRAMGDVSGRRYEEVFRRKKVIDDFIRSLTEFSDSSSRRA